MKERALFSNSGLPYLMSPCLCISDMPSEKKNVSPYSSLPSINYGMHFGQGMPGQLCVQHYNKRENSQNSQNWSAVVVRITQNSKYSACNALGHDRPRTYETRVRHRSCGSLIACEYPTKN